MWRRTAMGCDSSGDLCCISLCFCLFLACGGFITDGFLMECLSGQMVDWHWMLFIHARICIWFLFGLFPPGNSVTGCEKWIRTSRSYIVKTGMKRRHGNRRGRSALNLADVKSFIFKDIIKLINRTSGHDQGMDCPHFPVSPSLWNFKL